MTEDHIQILIVDDDVQLCLMLAYLVKKKGFEPQVVHDGESAMKMVRSRMPDVMLLDVKLPGMCGMEVLRQAKKLEQGLPVIMPIFVVILIIFLLLF